jgi:hypothetical protein
MSGQAELTEFGGILITIRSRKSHFEATKAIEDRLQRFSVPKLMEYATHADCEGAEAYVDKVWSPSKFSIGHAVVARDLFRYSDVSRLLGTEMVKVFEDAA